MSTSQLPAWHDEFQGRLTIKIGHEEYRGRHYGNGTLASHVGIALGSHSDFNPSLFEIISFSDDAQGTPVLVIRRIDATAIVDS